MFSVFSDEVAELHDFVFEVEVKFAGEKAAQVFVDKEIGGVAAGIGTQVLFERCHVADAMMQRGERVNIAADAGNDGCFGGVDNFLLLLCAGITLLLGIGEGPEFKGYANFGVGAGDFVGDGDEEAFRALDVIFFNVYVAKIEGDGHPLRGELIRGEFVAAFDVILFAVCPMEVDFFAVIWNSVSFVLRVASAWYEVACFVISGEEGVEVVADCFFSLCAGARGAVSRFCFEVVLNDSRVCVSLVDESSICIEHIVAEGFANLFLEFGDALMCVFGLGVFIKCGVDAFWEFVVDERFNLRASAVDDAVYAEVQVCRVGAEE